ncbi:MAG: MarR family transcriptional regulator [Desulfovibrionaceae bacterium]|jgi:DNA-binding MarR family transcriptional regulator|nr:MarR family transcriptional regulator [Desulfovibrionaceae bacterium]
MDKSRFILNESLGFLLARVHWALKTRFTRNLRELLPGMTPEQFAVLCRLWERDGLAQCEIAECIHKDMGNITRIVDALEEKGYVRRAFDPKDRRRRIVSLTEWARDVEKDLSRHAVHCRNKVFSCFDEAEYATFAELLNRLYDHLEKENEECS